VSTESRTLVPEAVDLVGVKYLCDNGDRPSGVGNGPGINGEDEGRSVLKAREQSRDSAACEMIGTLIILSLPVL
jgi:hypothetical protein